MITIVNETTLNKKSLLDLCAWSKVKPKQNITIKFIEQNDYILYQDKLCHGIVYSYLDSLFVIMANGNDPEFSIVEILVHELEHVRQNLSGVKYSSKIKELRAEKKEKQLRG